MRVKRIALLSFALFFLAAFASFGLSSATAADRASYHIYLIRGGVTPSGPDKTQAVTYWHGRLKGMGSRVKPLIVHNLDKGLCQTVAKNVQAATGKGEHVKLALVGYSWGGPTTLSVARCLKRHKITVNLVISVDGIAKLRVGNSIVPSNVDYAFNVFSSRMEFARLVKIKRIWSLSKAPHIENIEIKSGARHLQFPWQIRHCVLATLGQFVRGDVPSFHCKPEKLTDQGL